MIKLVPTIIAKNASEAMELYKEMLNLEVGMVHRLSSLNKTAPQEGQEDPIIHAELLKDGKPVLFFNEEPQQESPYGKTVYGNNITLTLNFDTVEEITKAFTLLKDATDSIIIVELFDAPWGAKFGMIKDRFNVVWQFNCNTQSI